MGRDGRVLLITECQVVVVARSAGCNHYTQDLIRQWDF